MTTLVLDKHKILSLAIKNGLENTHQIHKAIGNDPTYPTVNAAITGSDRSTLATVSAILLGIGIPDDQILSMPLSEFFVLHCPEDVKPQVANPG